MAPLRSAARISWLAGDALNHARAKVLDHFHSGDDRRPSFLCHFLSNASHSGDRRRNTRRALPRSTALTRRGSGIPARLGRSRLTSGSAARASLRARRGRAARGRRRAFRRRATGARRCCRRGFPPRLGTLRPLLASRRTAPTCFATRLLRPGRHRRFSSKSLTEKPLRG
jgi:hypothetical protein